MSLLLCCSQYPLVLLAVVVYTPSVRGIPSRFYGARRLDVRAAVVVYPLVPLALDPLIDLFPSGIHRRVTGIVVAAAIACRDPPRSDGPQMGHHIPENDWRVNLACRNLVPSDDAGLADLAEPDIDRPDWRMEALVHPD